MSKTIVIYDSKYGHTKQYAEWIAKECSCAALPRKQASSATLSEYNTIIYGGGLYAGGVSGINLLTENFNLLTTKNVILFTCGLADPENKENVAHIREALSKALSSDMMSHFQIFHLRGGIDYKRLNLLHKAMMGMMCKMLLGKNPSERSAEDEELLRTYGKVIDFTDRQTILPLVEYVNHCEASSDFTL